MGLTGFFEKAFRVKTGITISDSIGIGYSGSDPSSGGGTVAPIGSYLIQVPSGKRPIIWEKYGSGDTDWQRKNITYETASDPGVNNDNVDTAAIGVVFRRGDIWVNTNDDGTFICKDNTATAAVWLEIGSGSSTFGAEWALSESTAASSTTSSTWQQKLRVTKGSGIATGTYLVIFSAEIYNDTAGGYCEGQCTIDGTEVMFNRVQNGGASADHNTLSCVATVSLSGSNKNFDINWRRTSGTYTGNAYIAQARIEFFRIN